MRQNRSKLYHLSIPPSVSQDRAITRVRCSCPTRNLPARKTVCTRSGNVLSWSSRPLRYYKPLLEFYVRPLGYIKVRSCLIRTRGHHAPVTLYRRDLCVYDTSRGQKENFVRGKGILAISGIVLLALVLFLRGYCNLVYNCNSWKWEYGRCFRP